MNKLVSLIAVILLMMSISVFAGDIPEALLSEYDAKLYIGKVDGVTTSDDQSMPYEENKVVYIDITPTYKYKGDVETGVSERHSEHDFGTFIPEKDKEYLFGYIDENNFYIYEIESRDEKNIKLVDSDKYDMTRRLEAYLNEGAFAMAEQERSTLGEQISFAELLYAKPLSGSDAAKITLRYQDFLYEVDKEEFERVAQEIMITNVKNSPIHETNKEGAYKTVLYVELLDADEQAIAVGAVSRFGEVDRYGLGMSRLMAKDYEMKTDDLSKLYSLLPDDVQNEIAAPESPDASADASSKLPDIPQKSYIGWISGGAVIVFLIAFVIGYNVRKRKQK